MEKSEIEVSIAKDKQSCNSCHARNYDDPAATIGRRADKIVNIKAGAIVIHLCDQCAERLIGQLVVTGR